MVHAGHHRDPDPATEAEGGTRRREAGSESEPAKSAEPSESQAEETAKPDASSELRCTCGEDRSPNHPPSRCRPKTFYYTFIVFPAGEYTIGSVDDEPDRQKDEVRHAVKLTRPFALLDREITFEELIAFSPQYAGIHAAIRCETCGCRLRCRLVRLGGLLPLAGAAVGFVGGGSGVCGSGIAGQGGVSA